MTDVEPLVLRRSAEAVELRFSAGLVAGLVERVDLLDGAAVVSTVGVLPPADNGVGPVEVRLAPWSTELADPVVVVYFRRRQPSCAVPTPLTRGSFRIHPSMIKDVQMAHNDPVGDQSLAPDQHDDETFGISVTLDYGTSRAVGGIFDVRRVALDVGALPSDGVARAEALLDLVAEPGIDRGLNIETETVGSPLERSLAWQEIFDSPPLERNHLECTEPRSSDLVLMDGSRVEFADLAPGKWARQRGLKSYLTALDLDVPGFGMTGEQLFPEVYRRFAELVAQQFDVPSFRAIHVTFPTKLPPDRRDLLHLLLRPLATQVEMNVDEAAAAAGFSLMRRFGVDYVMGVEAFKVHARCPEGPRAWEEPELWDRAREWHENLLVIDVGGGTTDCALVKVVVADVTPSSAGDCLGRFYRLRPEVIASGGRLHLGGDLLTLEVFRLLKHRLGVPEEATTFEGLEGELAAERRRAFDALWTAAEETKHRGLRSADPAEVQVVCDGRDKSVSAAADRQAAVTVALADLGSGGTSIASDRTTVTAEDFATIVGKVVEQIASLAAGIAVGGLDVLEGEFKGEYIQSVDRVMLSGGSMLAETLRARVEDSLRYHFDQDGLKPTFDLEFDPVFCKTGTALGGMYLHGNADLAPKPNRVLDRLQEGECFLEVDSSRLYVNLAADFYLLRDTQDLDLKRPLFVRGQQLRGHGNVAYAQSEHWYPLRQQIDVHRYDVPLRNRPAREGDLPEEKVPAHTVWGGFDKLSRQLVEDLDRCGVVARFEIDQEERLTLVLCKGEPRPVLDGLPARLTSSPPDGLVREGVLGYDLFDVYHPRGDRWNSPLVSAGTPIPPGGLVVPVEGRHLFYRTDQTAGEDGRSGPGTVPSDLPDGGPVSELLLEVPERHEWLSVDDTGGLRTHQDRPLPPTVPDPRALLAAEPGSVFRAPLRSKPSYDREKDPFSGIH